MQVKITDTQIDLPTSWPAPLTESVKSIISTGHAETLEECAALWHLERLGLGEVEGDALTLKNIFWNQDNPAWTSAALAHALMYTYGYMDKTKLMKLKDDMGVTKLTGIALDGRNAYPEGHEDIVSALSKAHATYPHKDIEADILLGRYVTFIPMDLPVYQNAWETLKGFGLTPYAAYRTLVQMYMILFTGASSQDAAEALGLTQHHNAAVALYAALKLGTPMAMYNGHTLEEAMSYKHA